MKKLWIEDDFSDKIKRINELETWLKENVIIHYVEKWDTLRDLCEKYYKNPTYSKILTDKLWYKEKIIAGKYLYLPSKQDMLRLVRIIKTKQVNNKWYIRTENWELRIEKIDKIFLISLHLKILSDLIIQKFLNK